MYAPLQVKCWQIRRQTKAPQAAGTIHTDFEKGFICAEVTLKPSLIMLYLYNFRPKFIQISSFRPSDF